MTCLAHAALWSYEVIGLIEDLGSTQVILRYSVMVEIS